MLNFIRYLQGYVCIKICGYSPERFMNLCRNNGIVLWDITPNNHEYIMKMSIKDFKRIKPFIKKTRVKTVIIKKLGLPFFMYKNRKRKTFFWCIPICFLFLYFMTGFIWAFQFNGNKQVTDDMLYSFLEENGVEIGTRINSIKIEELERKIREEYNNVTWTSIKIKGTEFIVDINENDLSWNDKKKNSSNESDISSIADGKIISIITRSGIPKVKRGDEVKKGDILVEGSIPIFDNDGNIISYEYCNADADVYLKYKYPVNMKVSRYYQYKNYTGREKQKKYFRIGAKYLSFYALKIKYPKYDILEEEKQLLLFKDIYLPLFWGKKVYREYVMIDALYSEDAAKSLLNVKLNQEIQDLTEKGVQIIENNVKISDNSEDFFLTGFMVVVERNDLKTAVVKKQIEKMETQTLNE